MRRIGKRVLLAALCLSVLLSVLSPGVGAAEAARVTQTDAASFSARDLPAFSGEPFVPVDGNQPDFAPSELTAEAFEEYSAPDALGRCGTACANVCADIMPTEARGGIGMIRPSGWHTVRYDGIVEGNYLYNRCHLIGFQLSGENANPRNLITGTRYMNVSGMLPFENLVSAYVRETGNHVLYRAEPVFEEENLLASGIHLEACSVEDHGEGISFNVFVYNVQPGIRIDYRTGESRIDGTCQASDKYADIQEVREAETGYVLNTATGKFHTPLCGSVRLMKRENRREFYGNREEIIAQGYSPCKRCRP